MPPLRDDTQPASALPGALRRRRNELGWTLKELEARCGVGFSYISQIEKGHVVPSADKVTALCEALGLDPAPYVDWVLRAKLEDRATAAVFDSLTRRTAEPRGFIGEGHGRYRAGRYAVTGRVSADADSHLEFEPVENEAVTIPQGLEVFECKGDSMAPVALDGQYLLVHPDAPVRSGDLVIVALDDGRTLFKRYWDDGQTVTLESVNQQSHHRPIVARAAAVRWVKRVVGVQF